MVETMKAVVLSRFGGADAFELLDVPVPPVGARQLRVRVHATAVNPLDYQIRRGDYADLVPLPSIIGHDVSGVVEEVRHRDRQAGRAPRLLKAQRRGEHLLVEGFFEHPVEGFFVVLYLR